MGAASPSSEAKGRKLMGGEMGAGSPSSTLLATLMQECKLEEVWRLRCTEGLVPIWEPSVLDRLHHLRLLNLNHCALPSIPPGVLPLPSLPLPPSRWVTPNPLSFHPSRWAAPSSSPSIPPGWSPLPPSSFPPSWWPAPSLPSPPSFPVGGPFILFPSLPPSLPVGHPFLPPPFSAASVWATRSFPPLTPSRWATCSFSLPPSPSLSPHWSSPDSVPVVHTFVVPSMRLSSPRFLPPNMLILGCSIILPLYPASR